MDDAVAMRREVLAHVDQYPPKVAMVVARVLMSPNVEVSSDKTIAEVVVDMFAKGELVAVGDPSDMRHSEVRLP